MTNINCSENCIHQKNGKCWLTHVGIVSSVSGSRCAYFQQKDLPASQTDPKSKT